MELSELIQAIDIVEYISQFVELEQKGEEFWGLSCFKQENTPSFSVRRDPPFFYDYSSGTGGNLYTFVKAYHRCSGREAVEIIKRYAGYNGEIAESDRKLAATLDCKRFMPPKRAAKPAKRTTLPTNYMERFERRTDKLALWEREGISMESLDKFQVRYDRFSDRLVYPIYSPDGKIVNIGGRTVDPCWKEKGLRKYTYFHSWGALDTIYGLFENRASILAGREIILFEGCKSVLLADTWGIHNSGAILTSHLNSAQMKLLAALGCHVVFALDKEICIREDKNIQKLKSYVNVEYLRDKQGLLDSKDSPADKGIKVFNQLYERRLRLR